MEIRCPDCNRFLFEADPEAEIRGKFTIVCKRCPKDERGTAKVRITYPHPLGSGWVPLVERI